MSLTERTNTFGSSGFYMVNVRYLTPFGRHTKSGTAFRTFSPSDDNI